ncbi:hypothetical protein GCM10012320_31970 [Sinomonas cellulolyticus]|uniref:Uncharacterized protein n=1 Tax=Sinomonas cellulolyticus TaxID=2801916 RepID=A0ABS1JYB1_9MICC|nr:MULTISPECIES: hypothetical protein [Sinomonas]MBL0704215.1 hypothetical protein [Sinomonas cellulolyticus]GHG58312.1 hypothetical protein GCM10012320_31970 [Sinomonas sp. KCTC 49339]
MSDDTEMIQRGIGILTAALTWEPDDPAAAEMFKESLKTLARVDDDISVTFSGGSAEQAAALRDILPEVIRKVIEALAPDYTRLVLGMAIGFKAVADAYRDDVPEADVAAVLQAASLHLADEE